MNWLWLLLAVIAGGLSLTLFFIAWIPRTDDTEFVWFTPRRRIP